MEETKKKNKKIFYLMLGVSILLISGMTATFAYFSASKTAGSGTITGDTNNINNDTLSLNVERITFTGKTAASDNLVPAYFGKTGNILNVPTPASLTQNNVSSMISNKCEKDGYTGCHVYSITFSSSQTISEANLLLNLTVTGATDKSQWGYALFTETGNVAEHQTTGLTLLTGYARPAAIGSGISNLDIHNAGGLTANTPVTYYLVVYINDTDEAQNTAGKNYAVGTYNGSVTLKAMGGQVNAFFYTTPLSDFEYSTGTYTSPNGNITIPDNQVLLTKYIGTSPIVSIPSKYIIDGIEYTPVIYTYYKYNAEKGAFVDNETITDVKLSNDVIMASHQYSETSLTYNKAGYTFYGCTSLVNAPIIPSSVTEMTGTFSGCTSLVNAPAIPNSVTYMGATFSGCTSLVNAPVIPNSVTSMYMTFEDCTSLENAPEIPSSVTNMGYTFEGCTSLVNAPVIPSSVTNMQSTFFGCTSLVNAPAIPNSVTSMSRTFQGCTSLVNAPAIPSSVTNMKHTFAGCTSLVNPPDMTNATSVIEMGSGANSDGTFEGCTSLVSAPVIPDSVTNMDGAFSGCTSLVNAPEIPDLVTEISFAFKDCTSLVNAPVIPSSVTKMRETFSGCRKLEGMVRIDSDKVSGTYGTFSGTSKSITLDVPAESTTYTYFTKTGSSYAADYSKLPSNVTLVTH